MGYQLWVRNQDHIRSAGATIPEALDRLVEAIRNAGGAIHAVLEFDPPLPKSSLEAKYSQPEIYLIGGDDRFETDSPKRRPFETPDELAERLENADSYFQAPVCRNCRNATSLRSDKSLSVTYLPEGHDGAFGRVAHDVFTTIQIVSNEFLSLLSREEKDGLNLRPVHCDTNVGDFYEVLGPQGPPLVAVSDLEVNGWRCSLCAHREWGYWIDGFSIHSFIARADLPEHARGVFTVGSLPKIQLAITSQRWRDLAGRHGTRGFATSLLGVVPENEVIRFPDLPPLGA